MKPFGWVVGIFVGRRRRDVEAGVEELREDRRRRDEEVDESRREAKTKERRGVALLAGVNVRQMSEDDWLSMFEGEAAGRGPGNPRGRGD